MKTLSQVLKPVKYVPLTVSIRLPGRNQDIGGVTMHDVFNQSVIDILEKHCARSTSGCSRARGIKIQVIPGRRVTPSDLKGFNFLIFILPSGIYFFANMQHNMPVPYIIVDDSVLGSVLQMMPVQV